MDNILKKIVVAYYTLENDEIHSYYSKDRITFYDSNTNEEVNTDIITNLKNKIREAYKINDSYYKVKIFENYKSIFECKFNVQDINGILYSFITYSDTELLAIEDNKESFSDFIR